jgi:uncharacterized membrane protein YgdD (TMEM256/DUF423 family)
VTTRLGTRALEQLAAVEFFVEADDHGLPSTQSRCTQVSRWAKHGLDGFLGILVGRAELADLFALGHNQLRRGLGDFCRVLLAEFLAGRNNFFGFDRVCIQKLGRSGTGRSALAVIIPVNTFCHDSLLGRETNEVAHRRRVWRDDWVGLQQEDQPMWTTVAAISGTLAVIAGAFGAHALKARLSPEQLESWTTASQYHLLHSIVILALGLFAAQSGKSIKLPASLFATGIVLFSGSIYLLVLTKMRWLGPITPIGGLLLILGWLSLIRVGND